MTELVDTPSRAFEKLARPDLPRQRREPPLKAFKLFFKYSIGKPNFSAYRVISPKRADDVKVAKVCPVV